MREEKPVAFNTIKAAMAFVYLTIAFSNIADATFLERGVTCE